MAIEVALKRKYKSQAKTIEKLNEFLAERPIPMIPDLNSTEENPLPDILEFTPIEHITNVVFDIFILGECKLGKEKLRKASDPFDNSPYELQE